MYRKVKNQPARVIFHRQKKVKHYNISHQNINNSKPHQPPKLPNINLSFQEDENYHREPSK
jgi:hypothetical protein